MDIGVALRGELNDRMRGALDEAKDITEKTLQGVRDLSQLLHPSTLDDFGLPETLRAYLKRFAERTGINAQLVTVPQGRLSSDIESCIYRIVQEALNNIARHSGATACTVALTTGERALQLTATDNGRGLAAAANGHGLGLIAMRERAQALGGSFSINSVPGDGTRVLVTLPT